MAAGRSRLVDHPGDETLMMILLRKLIAVAIMAGLWAPASALAQPAKVAGVAAPVSETALAQAPAAPAVAPVLAAGKVVTITVLHTNDFHGQLEPSGSNPGIARLGHVINEVVGAKTDPRNVVLLDAGDEMQGSLLSNLQQGEPTIDLFNTLGYHAATLGNHEFDWGQDALATRAQQANYPFVAANLVVSDAATCDTAGWTSPSFVKPWITLTVGAPGNEAVLGIVGVTSQETPYITLASATEGLCFKDPAEAVFHYYDQVKAAGANTLIVLSHLGNTDGGYGYGFPVYGDQTLARKLTAAGKPVALIIGGHSHTNLNAAQVISGTTVVQAYSNGRKLGVADLAIDTTANTTLVNWAPITVTADLAPDAAVQTQLEKWSTDPGYQAAINQVIGFTQVDLVRNYNGDSLMGEFIDDAIYNDLNADATPANDVDLFFNNAGGLRADITSTVKPLTLTYGMMFNVLPFGNATTVGEMTGAQVLDLLNQSATLFKGALQPAGIKFTFYAYTDTLPGPQPVAWGAYDVTVKNRKTNTWQPLVLTKTYKVGTNEFLAPAGQDGYTPFKSMANITYWGDMLNGANRWVSKTYGTPRKAYKGPNGDGKPDGRITRDGDAAGGSIVPVTILHHNDSHGRLAPSGTAAGYTQLATLIRQERAHNPTRTLLLAAGDQIQGDSMLAFYKTSFTGQGADGTTLPAALMPNPSLAVMNAMSYTAMTLGNHEFNFGAYIFTSTLKQATFPLLQANIKDTGTYGLAQAGLKPSIVVKLKDNKNKDIRVAILGLGNHRIPNYELPSNIPGLKFTDPIDEAKKRVPALRGANDVVIALTHLGFTADPKSVEVDSHVDTELARQTAGVDAIIGGHSHTDPSKGQAPYPYLPVLVSSPDGKPVIISQANRYNTYLGEVVLGLRAKGGRYEVVARAGRYLAVSTKAGAATPEDPAVKAIVDPYVKFLAGYTGTVVGRSSAPIDTLKAFTDETNGANLQADASVWQLAQAGIRVDFHLSGAITNQAIVTTATVSSPLNVTVGDLFQLMPYENSLVVFKLNGPQLKQILERGYRNYYYYKYVPDYGGYAYYPTCLLDISAGGKITYKDAYPAPYTSTVESVQSLEVNGQAVDFKDAKTFYTVSTVNYLAAGSCNFSDQDAQGNSATLWPLNQIVADTQYYVRDAVVNYFKAQAGVVSPAVEGRLVFTK
jgi:2',3'-cyclic-nucleotide 2'-phosphodiesterase (5'-nucleotidase family)